MPKSSTKPFRMAPLQRLTVRPIEDPTEQAAVDERLKSLEEALSHTAAPSSPIPATKNTGSSDSQTPGIKPRSKPQPLTPSTPSARKRRR
jgi:hypothetical protein